MKRSDSQKARAGFTLIELLVVVGAIAILLTAVLSFMGGSSDSAVNAQCKNNMRNLAQGVISYAQSRAENDGHFPAASMYRSLDTHTTSKKLHFYPHRPWISNLGDISFLNHSSTSREVGEVVHFTAGEDEIRTAITNGAIWQTAGESYEVYRCPVHARSYEKKNSGRQPGWSYMMNQEFGFNRNGANVMGFFGSRISDRITVATDTAGLRKKSASRGHDKVLLLAEVQGVDIDDAKHGISLKAVVSGSGTETDALLEYTKEDMGFNHRIGKNRYGGNVAFADGHVESIILPTKMSRRDLTRYLCQGFDVPHDGRAYTPNADDEK